MVSPVLVNEYRLFPSYWFWHKWYVMYIIETSLLGMISTGDPYSYCCDIVSNLISNRYLRYIYIFFSLLIYVSGSICTPPDDFTCYQSKQFNIFLYIPFRGGGFNPVNPILIYHQKNTTILIYIYRAYNAQALQDMRIYNITKIRWHFVTPPPTNTYQFFLWGSVYV